MKKLNPLAILTILILVACSHGSGQWSNDPAVNTPISVSSGDKYRPEVISDGEGGSIIVWHDFRPGGQADLYAQKLDQNGIAQWTPEGVLVSGAPGHQWGTTLASDGDGGVVVAFHDERVGGPNFDIYTQRIDREGVARWTVDGVPIAVSGSHDEWPTIASDGKGGAIIAWGRNAIHAQRVDASGAVKWVANGISVCSASGDHRFPKIIPDGAGGALVTWLDQRSGYDAYLQRIDSSGAVQWATDGVKAVTAGGGHDRPSLVTDGAGGAILAWEDSRNSAMDIYAQRMNGSGVRLWGANGVAVTAAAGNQFFPFEGFGSPTQIVADSQGGAIIAWIDNRDGGNDVYAQRLNSAGAVQWTANGAPVSVADGGQGWVTLLADGASGAIFTWEDGRPGGTYDLYAQRLDADGAPVWALDGLPLATAAGVQERPKMATYADGKAVVAFEDYRNGQFELFVQGISIDGTLGNQPPIRVTSPVSPDEWFTGGSYAVIWTADSTVDNVDISISADGGATWTPVATGVAAQTGSIPITAPTLPVPNREMMVRVRDAADSSVYANSPMFSLIGDALELGLVAYFPLDGQPDDQSGYGNDAVPDAPQPGQDRFGHNNKAYDFNGVSDRMRVADAPVLALTGSMTIACWVNELAFPEGRVFSQLVFRGDDRIGLDPYHLSITPSNAFRFQISSGIAIDYVESPDSYDGWHHVAAILDIAAGEMSLIVDGQVVASKLTPLRPFRNLEAAASPGVGLGNTQGAPSGGHHHPLHGSLDEVRIYRRALSPGEVEQLFGLDAHTINASAAPHGSISPSGIQYAEPGSSRRFTFLPDLGYELEAVFVDDLHVDSTEGYTFIDIQESHRIHVTFSPVFVSQGIRVTLSLENGVSSKDITLGLEAGAAYGIFRVDPLAGAVDSVAGETELPPPAPASFDARFVAPPGNSPLFGGGSWVDVRRFIKPSQSDTFRIALRTGAPGTDPIIINWSKQYVSTAFEGRVTMDGGTIDMKLVDNATFPPGTQSVLIVANDPAVPYLYSEGWNMASIPVNQAAPRSEIFPSSNSDAFAFSSSQGYILRNTLQPSEGFWMKFPGLIQELDFPGDSLLTDTVEITPGWNLIGAMYQPLSVSDVSTIPEGILASRYFGFRGGYRPTETIEPGQGYWVKASAPGLLIYNLPSGQVGKSIAAEPEAGLGSLTIVDAAGRKQTLYYGETRREIGLFELPPVPPEGAFDVRFAGDVSILSSGPGVRAGDIRLSGAEFPITIRWREAAGMDAKLELGGAPMELTGEGEVRLTATPLSVRLVLGESAVPERFLLSEAYPNPFNPTTNFRIDLPEETRVTMKIYDVLGSEVATLVDEFWSPGSRVVTWDASGTPSGMYYCRIVAGGHSDARKVLLLK